MMNKLGLFGTSLMAAFMLVAPAFAQDRAQPPSPNGNAVLTAIPQQVPNVEKQMTAVEKIHDMRVYSEGTSNEVGLFVNFAKDPEIPPSALIPAVIKKLNVMSDGKANIQVRTNFSEGNVTEFTSFVGGIALPTYDLGTLQMGLENTVKALEAKPKNREVKQQEHIPGELHSSLQ